MPRRISQRTTCKGPVTRQTTVINPCSVHDRCTWEMVKNRKINRCMDCSKYILRGVMMFRPKAWEPEPSRQRICQRCARRK